MPHMGRTTTKSDEDHYLIVLPEDLGVPPSSPLEELVDSDDNDDDHDHDVSDGGDDEDNKDDGDSADDDGDDASDDGRVLKSLRNVKKKTRILLDLAVASGMIYACPYCIDTDYQYFNWMDQFPDYCPKIGNSRLYV
jgi:hypothetical protein